MFNNNYFLKLSYLYFIFYRDTLEQAEAELIRLLEAELEK